ncbi:hypothetical protein N7540_011126 [Penicillium herquei]|nr:hypothetical protein N7540_011126 [Penicillium herquei]
MSHIPALTVFISAALAQNAVINIPERQQTVTAGSDLIVQVLRPNLLTNSQEMALAIGFSFCANGGCSPASEDMGTVVYSGNFNPVSHEEFLPPYQNFTVPIPSSYSSGKAQVNVAHEASAGHIVAS